MTTEIHASTPAGADDEAAFQTMRTDAVLTGRAMSSGEYLAGLIGHGLLETVGRPDKLPADVFAGEDPVLVQRVWDRALAVGFHAGRMSVTRTHPEELERSRVQFEAIGFAAMEGLVSRSRGLAVRAQVHPGDREIAREH
ncbi:hypothetical protein [Streptomyces sp. NPDC093269]|uniref:hypothetical protein n=1 Tax=Streptomyces sp. NPDC093269 TaxID=3366038 RepID=UPI003806E193